MLRNHQHNSGCYYHGLVDQEHGRWFHLRCDICDLLSATGTVECYQLSVVVCDCLEQIFGIITKLLLRLHQAACRLLQTKPVLLTDVKSVPDILKGRLLYYLHLRELLSEGKQKNRRSVVMLHY